MGGPLVINHRDHKGEQKEECNEIDYGLWKVNQRIIKKMYVLENCKTLQSLFPMWVEVQ